MAHPERWVVVGDGVSTATLERLAERGGASVAGTISPLPRRAGGIDKLQIFEELQRLGATRAVLGQSLSPQADLAELVADFRALGVSVSIVPSIVDQLEYAGLAPQELAGVPMFGVHALAPLRRENHESEDRNRVATHTVPRVSVVIPTKNEAENLPHVLPRLPADLHEVILVDAHSTDATVETARRLCPEVRVVTQTGNGKGNALQSGFAAVTGDVVVMLDADGSADPAEIPQFVAALQQGCDFAKGSRTLPGGGSTDITRLRDLGNQGLTKVVNLLFGTRFTDLCYGYNAFWAHCLPHISLDVSGFEVETAINLRVVKAGLTLAEIPSVEHSRLHGRTNLNTFRDGFRVLQTILKEWRTSYALQRCSPGRPTPDCRPCCGGRPMMRTWSFAATSGPSRPEAVAVSEVGDNRVGESPVTRNQSIQGASSRSNESPSAREVGREGVKAAVSVVICAYAEERWDCLIEAVRSVEHQTDPAREVIVVIDHNEQLLERTRRELPRATVIANCGERGAGGARNAGVEAASGSIIAFLDDDAVATPDWIEEMHGPLAQPNVLGVGGEVLPHWQAATPRWFPSEFGWVLGCSYRGLPESTSPIRNPMAGNMAVRKGVFLALGGYRSGHGNVQFDSRDLQGGKRLRFVTRQSGCEETDLCIRALRRWPGSVWIYHPPMRVHHRVPRSRLSWSYFLARCNDEGLAKATVVVAQSGAEIGLSTERSYVFRTLVDGVWRGIEDSLKGDPWGLARASAIIIGFSVTAFGYLRGRVGSIARAPFSRWAPSPTLEEGSRR